MYIFFRLIFLFFLCVWVWKFVRRFFFLYMWNRMILSLEPRLIYTGPLMTRGIVLFLVSFYSIFLLLVKCVYKFFFLFDWPIFSTRKIIVFLALFVFLSFFTPCCVSCDFVLRGLYLRFSRVEQRITTNSKTNMNQLTPPPRTPPCQYARTQYFLKSI